MLKNIIHLPAVVALALADFTKDTAHAFGCINIQKTSRLLQESAYLLIDTKGSCNSKDFRLLMGRSKITNKVKFHLFSHHTFSNSETQSIKNKITRLLDTEKLYVVERYSKELYINRYEKILAELQQGFGLCSTLKATKESSESFHLLHVSSANAGRAKELGAVINQDFKRYVISSNHPNLKHPEIEQWLPKNNPMFQLENPKKLMRLTRLFKEKGASCVRNISRSGKLKMDTWVVFLDHPCLEDLRIYITDTEFRLYLNISKHDHEVAKKLGALWDKNCCKFFTTNTAENIAKFNKWMPYNNPELLVYIRDHYFGRLRKYGLHTVDNGYYRRIYIDNTDLHEILGYQERSLNEHELLKKELVMLYVGKNDFDQVRELGAVQRRVMRRLEWFISTDHANYSALQQWLPENNPKCYLTDQSPDECKLLGGFYDIHQREWFMYEKDYWQQFKQVKVA